jgi:DNA-binding HxlR family transcriptional regulator
MATNRPSVEEGFSQEPLFLKKLLGQPRVLYHPVRLAILVELTRIGVVDYVQLRHDLNISDGALATHIKALVKNGLIEYRKEPEGTRERAHCAITREGLRSTKEFLGLLGRLNEVPNR